MKQSFTQMLLLTVAKMCKRTHSKGYDLDIIYQHSQTAIIVSVTVGHHKCTGTLIEAGVKINV